MTKAILIVTSSNGMMPEHTVYITKIYDKTRDPILCMAAVYSANDVCVSIKAPFSILYLQSVISSRSALKGVGPDMTARTIDRGCINCLDVMIPFLLIISISRSTRNLSSD